MRTIQRAALYLCIFVCAASAQQSPLAPHSMYEPPMAAAAQTLADSTANIPADLLTTGEKTQWQQTGRYDETVRIMRRIAQLSPQVKIIQFGTTAQGRPMYAMILSSDEAFTPQLAAKTNKVVILIQSGIHSGEIEGKDTALMLARDMVVTKRRTRWLDSAIFLIIPVFNVDGHENRSPFNRANQNGPDVAGTRAQAQQLNLNRDYMKAATPEMHGFLALYQAWLPDFMFDNHVTDGADYQYDVTWDMAHHDDIGAPTAAWVNDRFIPEINKRMEGSGHLVSPYGALRNTRPGAPSRSASSNEVGSNTRPEFFVEVFSPRYSHLYTAALNRPCLLVETHSLKSPMTRAWANYDIMVHSIDIVTEDPQKLRSAIRASDAKYAAMAGDRSAPPIFLAGKTSDSSHPLLYHSLKTATFKSEITGTDVVRYTAEKDDFETRTHDGVDTTASTQIPLAFLIPAEWKDIHDELALHGVVMEPVTKPLSQDFETWRFTEVKYVNSGEAGQLVDYTLHPVTEHVDVPAGSWYVPLNQPRARLIMNLLHPAAPDALIRLGFAGSIFQSMGRIGANPYLSVPIATKVAEEHPELLAEFNAKLAADPAFAADPNARITWWISRSSYQPSASNRYPILQIWTKTW
jgi:murein tripeptide amidase MpaA